MLNYQKITEDWWDKNKAFRRMICMWWMKIWAFPYLFWMDFGCFGWHISFQRRELKSPQPIFWLENLQETPDLCARKPMVSSRGSLQLTQLIIGPIGLGDAPAWDCNHRRIDRTVWSDSQWMSDIPSPNRRTCNRILIFWVGSYSWGWGCCLEGRMLRSTTTWRAQLASCQKS